MLEYFTDPVLRAPTIGSILMCIGASLVGVLAFLRKSSLVGETLSHAAYPGVILGALASLLFAGSGDLLLSFLIMLGAFLTSLLGIFSLHTLEKKFHIRPDSALCFVLAAFFGVGITLASRVQFTHATLYVQSLTYLYGQAATMTDYHIWLYAVLALVIIFAVFVLFKELEVISFDREYAKSLGIWVQGIDALLFFLIALAIVVGIRSVGVVMMSAMLIAPATCARQLTKKLSKMLVLAALIGALSAYFGVVISVEGTKALMKGATGSKVSLPTGPMIVLVASAFAILSLFFAKERGLFFRFLRMFRFRVQCLSENILKGFWYQGPAGQPVCLSSVTALHTASAILVKWIVSRLCREGWLKKVDSKTFCLTPDGQKKGAHIVRLHRLWELYLADYLAIGAERVHKSAEEMEHILTPEIEKRLTDLLKHPKFDPHHQPIPEEFE
jgi:manganese/zinc/iron transport system permease protein